MGTEGESYTASLMPSQSLAIQCKHWNEFKKHAARLVETRESWLSTQVDEENRSGSLCVIPEEE